MTPAGRERAIKSLSRDQGAVVENLVHKIQRQMHDEHSRQIDVFHQMDVDGSGQLDARELHRALGQLPGVAPTKAEVAALVAALDADGSGTVSIEEFFAYLKHAKRMQSNLRVGPKHAVGTPASQKKAARVPIGATPSKAKGGPPRVEMEQQLQAANSENYLLQMQLTKLQSTLKQTQTKLKTVQAWRDVSEAEGEAVETSSASSAVQTSPYEPLFEQQIAGLQAQLSATEAKLKAAQQSQLQLRSVQAWKASSSPPRSKPEPEPEPAQVEEQEPPARQYSPRRLPWSPRKQQKQQQQQRRQPLASPDKEAIKVQVRKEEAAKLATAQAESIRLRSELDTMQRKLAKTEAETEAMRTHNSMLRTWPRKHRRTVAAADRSPAQTSLLGVFRTQRPASWSVALSLPFLLNVMV